MLICQEPDQVAWRKVQAHISVLERAQTQDVGVVCDWPVGLPRRELMTRLYRPTPALGPHLWHTSEWSLTCSLPWQSTNVPGCPKGQRPGWLRRRPAAD
jgi:hypothetical protein